MVEARTNEPLLLPLSWVGYLALALAGGGGVVRAVWVRCALLLGGSFWRNPKVCVRGEVGGG